jgi:hypothetical protein
MISGSARGRSGLFELSAMIACCGPIAADLVR